MRAGHVVNSFDPSCDVLRCVRELDKHSRHTHCLYIRSPHPDAHVYGFDQPERPGWTMKEGEAGELMAGADVIIYHFKGWEDGWHDLSRPAAFRNCNIYFNKDTGKFWSAGVYNAPSYDRYSLVASSHAGAADFLPEGRFRWLPDLLPLDGPYSFDPSPRSPAVSYIKHADDLVNANFGSAGHLDCSKTPHGSVLARRRSEATVVIDNVCDGHYGLAGQEAAILGLPVVGWNHPQTLAAMDGWVKAGTEFPFTQAETIGGAIAAATRLAAENSDSRRQAIRAWAEEFLNPQRLIAAYWDPFIDELAASGGNP
jgi:hypothetical protein